MLPHSISNFSFFRSLSVHGEIKEQFRLRNLQKRTRGNFLVFPAFKVFSFLFILNAISDTWSFESHLPSCEEACIVQVGVVAMGFALKGFIRLKKILKIHETDEIYSQRFFGFWFFFAEFSGKYLCTVNEFIEDNPIWNISKIIIKLRFFIVKSLQFFPSFTASTEGIDQHAMITSLFAFCRLSRSAEQSMNSNPEVSFLHCAHRLSQCCLTRAVCPFSSLSKKVKSGRKKEVK